MRVICIDDSPGKKSGDVPNFKYGDILNAYQSVKFSDSYNIDEHLVSVRTGGLKAWLKSRFILLSTTDETEFHREYGFQKLINQNI